MPLKKPRIIIAGQVPPPWGGQNIMVGKAVAQFARSDRCESVHLPFFFTPDFKSARQASAGKMLELGKVIVRLLRLRLTGPVDALLYPTGGPQKVPMIRDILLLPWLLLLSRRVILYFHAAGIADRLQKNPNEQITRLVSWFYGKAFAAIVMTNFNRRDPEAVGITRIAVVPHRIDDDFDARLLHRGQAGSVRFLYVGHLCPDKGTPQLLEAFAQLHRKHPGLGLKLDLVGECLPPFTETELIGLIESLHLQSHVSLAGVLTGQAKAEAFGRADLFVFPTIAPYESFGLVLAEAMAWKLPIVASAWRGNPDVLTADAGAISFPVSPSFVEGIAGALDQAIEERGRWTDWGATNRLIFERRYSEKEAQDWLVEPILSLLDERSNSAA